MACVDPVSLLRRHFGYSGFRPGQLELVEAVLSGRDALGVLPTGGGKSVCYQVPALALRGLCVVLTPLVSLMEDQVRRAGQAGLRAAHLSAGQPSELRRAMLDRARSGALDLLFLAPERLEVHGFLDALVPAGVRLLAVDEAHCISEWGDDFRPSYRNIGRIRERIGAPVLALTATATPSVREDIARSLGLRDPVRVVRSFDRPNLRWGVYPGGSLADRAREAYRLIRYVRGPVIVYAGTRRAVDRVRDVLAGLGATTEAYHAGLEAAERTRIQQAFMEGRFRVVVATNAFGMGIDKSDIRLVIHAQLPSTLESYYQEAGRAGRDGEPSWCVAFRRRADEALGRGFIDRTHPPPAALADTHRRLLRMADPAQVVEASADELARRLGRRMTRQEALSQVGALERAGAVRLLDGSLEIDPDGTGSTRAGSQSLRMGIRRRAELTQARRLRAAARSKLRAVARYAIDRGCRRRALLAYFGEEAPPRCGACDRCAGALTPDRLVSIRNPWNDI
jgi:ATP-dependent DNA helicase RecQ